MNTKINYVDGASLLKNLFANINDDNSLNTKTNQVEKKDISDLMTPEALQQRDEKIDELVKKGISSLTQLIPELKKPKVEVKGLDDLSHFFKENKLFIDANKIKAGDFSFISNDMMMLISLIVKYRENMIKQYEASRELSNVFMQIGLSIADKIKKNAYERSGVLLSAAISSSVLSMAVHGIGASMSMRGLSKEMPAGGSTNKTMMLGNFTSMTADPLSKITDQSIQNRAIQLEGEEKVLNANSTATGQVATNNTDVQRSQEDIIKAFVQTMEAIIRADQDTVSAIAGNIRG